MHYYSTNDNTIRVTLKQAVMEGLAPDGGLYMPVTIPSLPKNFFLQLPEKPLREIAFQVAKNLLGDDLTDEVLRKIITHTIQFEAPLVELEENIYSLELFHGPTLAFKDFGARFLSGLLGYFAEQQSKEITILVATSGDTGSAVANGFFNVPGTRVIVLYPSGKVSEIQEKQFTTLGGNITALEVDGTFDDCQRLVKKAFLDSELKKNLQLASANSINIARLIPQTFYYFRAIAQLKSPDKGVVFSVPSGNFGNLTAGLIAKRMGLPISKFIAATNVNDIVPTYLHTGQFSPRPSVQTISNAMDVGNPSNFARMIDLYRNNLGSLTVDIEGYHFSDPETAQTIESFFQTKRYTLDPHGAVGYLGLKKYLKENSKGEAGIFLETAHPGKFNELVEKSIHQKIDLPERLLQFVMKQKTSIAMRNDFEQLKEILLN
jgi:threonine synthase